MTTTVDHGHSITARKFFDEHYDGKSILMPTLSPESHFQFETLRRRNFEGDPRFSQKWCLLDLSQSTPCDLGYLTVPNIAAI
jgi:hypothetical protein